MFKSLRIALAMAMLASPLSANYVVQSVPELSVEQTEWLNEHRTNKDYGTHDNYFWVRLDTGKIFSVSITDYRKTKHAFWGDFDEYFEEMLEARIEKNIDDARTQFSLGVKLLSDLIGSGLSQETALILVKFNVPGFGYNEEEDDLFYIDPITQVHIN